MTFRAPRIRIFQSVTAGLAMFILLLATPLFPDQTRSSDAGPAAQIQGGSGWVGNDDTVRIGMRVRTLGPVDTAAQTFSASFDLWLLGDRLPDPGGLVFANAATPIRLGEPASIRTVDSREYRLYRIEGSFRYRSSASDLVDGRLHLDISLLDESNTATRIAIVPDIEASTLLPAGERSPTSDGAWTVAQATLRSRITTLPTLGDPLYSGATSRHSTLVAAFVLSEASPGVVQVIQRLLPDALAAPVMAAMLLLLALVPLLSRYDAKPSPWRLLTVLLAVTLLLAASGDVFATALARNLSPSAVQTTMDAFTAAWLGLGAAWLLGLVPILVWRPLQARTGTPASALERTVVNVVIILTFVLFFLSRALHLPASSIGAASGVLTIVLGLALQNIILDLFAGILLNLEKPFRLFNWVTVSTGGPAPIYGQVRNMNWRTTQLQTRDNDLVFIPNSVMARSSVNNHASPSIPSRLKVDVILDDGIDTAHARAIMKAAAMRSAEAGLILDQPAPVAVIIGVEDYGVRYRVCFYVNLNIMSDSQGVNSVAENVLMALSEAGLHLALRKSKSFEPPDAEHNVIQIRPSARSAGSPAASRSPRRGPVGASILSAEEVQLVRESWAAARPLGDQVAVLFYNRLFDIAPALRDLFRSDQQAQRTKLLTMINMLVKALDNPDAVIDALSDLGLRHTSYGVKFGDYDKVGQALLWTLEKGLGPAFDGPTRNAWTKLYTTMATVMSGAGGQTATA